MKNSVYIILLNYHGFNDTIECINSLMKLEQVDFRIVIVDNSETVDDFNKLISFAKQQSCTSISFNNDECIKYKNEKLILIRSNTNKGFAHGNNIGIRFSMQQANCKFLWILNNDTVVLPDSLANLVIKHNENPKVLLGSKLVYYYHKNTLQAVGGRFNETLYIPEHVGEGLPVTTLKATLPKIHYPLGAAMFVDRKFIDEVGLLNEAYFLYYEELDWVYRARSYGYLVDWCENSVVYHKEGASIGSSYSNEKSDFSEEHLFKSRQLFIKTHFGLNSKFYLTTFLLIANRFRKGKFKLAKKLIKNTYNDIK